MFHLLKPDDFSFFHYFDGVYFILFVVFKSNNSDPAKGAGADRLVNFEIG